MIGTITQKVIKIGTSKGVTIPSKELKVAGIEEGDYVKCTFEKVDVAAQTPKEYDTFVKQYSETLKNLADR